MQKKIKPKAPLRGKKQNKASNKKNSEEKSHKRDWVWIDLEMTGLDPEKETILEIATVITNSELEITAVGPDLVIKVEEERLRKMDAWNIQHHTDSGLISHVRDSDTTLEQAEKETLKFIKKHAKEKECVLCGSSVYHDKNFLKKCMPTLHSFFHFRIIDVASVIELAKRWYPEVRAYKYNATHRSLDDIKESIDALKYYRERVFKEPMKNYNKEDIS